MVFGRNRRYDQHRWGDIDNDGSPDLLAGNDTSLSKLYHNNNGTLAEQGTAWNTMEGNLTTSVAWGDIDNDGDLDLVIGNDGQPNHLYLNDALGLRHRASWTAADEHDTSSVAWGDVDGDGDLDLAVGNGRKIPGYPGQANALYRNDNGTLTTGAVWSSEETDDTTSIAWGDMDGDGDLDLAAGNDGEPNRLYRNDDGTLTTGAVWSSLEDEQTTSVAWGDVDGDGDLDLVVGNDDEPNRLYRNQGGTLTPGAVWGTAESDDTTSVAWGDVDGDGDLDLVVGNEYAPNRLYRNHRGTLQTTAAWSSSEIDHTTSVALGDYDGDGDLDLAVGNDYQPNRLYRNDHGTFTSNGVWRSLEAERTSGVAWGDVDGDGDLDLAAGDYGGTTKLYQNDQGTLTAGAAWGSEEKNATTAVAWGDVDNDGDLDLATVAGKSAVGGEWIADYLYLNRRDARASTAPIPTIHITQPVPPGGVSFYASAHIWEAATIAFDYTLTHRDSLPVRQVLGFYSLDGGDNWQPAIPSPQTPTTNLASSPGGTKHTYIWEVFESGVMGQSDDVVFRLQAIPAVTSPAHHHHLAGPYRHGSFATTTYPFRVRGTQVRVMQQGSPVAQALVYHLPAGQVRGAQPIAVGSSSGNETGQSEPFHTNAHGYLEGRSNLQVGDRLVALRPIQSTDTYTLYHTSAAPDPQGLDFYPIETPGVQVLNVSPDHPFLLFNLNVSLEWDSHRDEAFLSRLRYDLSRTSELLFDWTNGQVALGQLQVYQDHDYWDEAHIRVYATNRLRPNAEQGGIVEEKTTDPDRTTLSYEPGQVRMGSIWNRFGEATGNLSEDWPRTLAHELGHYCLFLDDNYLGLNEDGVLVPVDTCPGAMSDPYRDDYSEFVAPSQWLPACQQTLSHHLTGRSDWATIRTFYPMLSAQPLNEGPSGLPLDITDISFVLPLTPSEVLEVPIFYLNYQGGRLQPGPDARALLFQHDETIPGDYPWVLDLGRPRLDQVEAHGARPGDRLCVYEPGERRVGCEVITAGDDQIEVFATDWQPEIVVSPVTSHTINLEVSQVSGEHEQPVYARIYPEQDPSRTMVLSRTSEGSYTGTFQLDEPAIQGYVQVWAETPEDTSPRESITDYSMGGNPGHRKSRSGHRKSRSGHRKSRSGHRKSRSAPAVSSDGQVIIYGDTLEFETGEFYTLQAATRLRSIPPWVTPVGQAYWLSASANAPDLRQTSISFGYLGNEVPTGEEHWLRVYFWDEAQQAWRNLPTSLDTYQNIASAPTQGAGLYALMSSIELPMKSAGWNLFAYPVQASRPVQEALQSIDGHYTTVYAYEAGATEPWSVYDAGAPEWVNTLDRLSFGNGYWLFVTQPVTVSLKGATEDPENTENISHLVSTLPNPPATYYGLLEPSAVFQPVAGMQVTATISGTVCGENKVRFVNGQPAMLVHVLAEWLGGNKGCGTTGSPVRFTVGSFQFPETYAWDNTRLHHLSGHRVYLPLLER
ncbi:MAG: VCBS repeat-containing protein [Chloroflexaceae bacterium]|nr:VCBS repeat-containing protein [Chloroflexaceae bacterium]